MNSTCTGGDARWSTCPFLTSPSSLTPPLSAATRGYTQEPGWAKIINMWMNVFNGLVPPGFSMQLTLGGGGGTKGCPSASDDPYMVCAGLWEEWCYPGLSSETSQRISEVPSSDEVSLWWAGILWSDDVILLFVTGLRDLLFSNLIGPLSKAQQR